MTIKITTQITGAEAIKAAFTRAQAGIAGNEPWVLDVITHAIAENTKLRIAEGKRPDGGAQTPLKSRQGVPLRNTGTHILNRITAKVTGKEGFVGLSFDGARIHQFGGTITPKKGQYLKFRIGGNGFVSVKQVIIPARPYLGISAQDRRDVDEILQKYMKASLG